MSELKNYYEVLEISSSAKTEDIYQSYQRAKMAYANDSLALYSLMSQDECRNVLELVEEAYSILSDPNKRKRYDEARGISRDFQLNNYNQQTINSEATTANENRIDQQFDSQNNQQNVESSHLFNQDFKISSNKDFAATTTYSNQGANGQGSNVGKLVTQKRFALDFVASTDFEREIEETLEFNGALLKKIREYKNVDLERLADMTKVSRSHLHNIELEEFNKLPAPVYVRGFVYQYAKCLKLKPDLVANSYLVRMKSIKP